MSVEIKHIHAEEHYRAVEQLQREIWGAADIEIIPHDVLITAQKNGGALLGAFDSNQTPSALVGFTFGFIGLLPNGEVKLCSHVAGVVEAYRDQNIGYLLKLAQRQYALKKGIRLITWTFDPLESRNARFNFHKLGVTCNTFLPNVYGEMRDVMNAGLPSDRFQVDWQIASSHVEASLAGTTPQLLPSTLRAKGVFINDTTAGEFPQPADNVVLLEGKQCLAEIPANFQAIKAADFKLARAWRQHVRELFEKAFASNYTVVDLLVEDGRSYYLLEQNKS